MGSVIAVLDSVNPFFADGRRLLLNPVSQVLRRNRIYALTGPNGCGKTTILNVVAGLHSRFDGETRGPGSREPDDGRTDGIRVRISYLFQRTPAPDTLRVSEFLRLAGIHGLAAELDRRKPPALSNTRRFIGTLSSGERQYLGAAVVLSRPADLYLLDEPLRHLAPELATIVVKRAVGLCREDSTIIVVEHELLRFWTAESDIELLPVKSGTTPEA